MRITVAAVVLLAVCSCGVATRQPSAPNPAPTSQPGWLLVTERDQNVSVHAGQKIEVALTEKPGMTQWGPITVDDRTILQPVPTGMMPMRGVTIAGFEAIEAGTANITSSAGPQCSPNQACPMYAVLFRVTVRVT